MNSDTGARAGDGGILVWASMGVAAIALLIAVVALVRPGGAPVPATPPAAEEAAPAEEPVMKVVYHADFADPRRFSAMLTSINNMANTYQESMTDYDIRIVFVAHGIRFVTADKLAKTPFAEDAALRKVRQQLLERLTSLHEIQGIKLELCNITRAAIGLDEEKLLPGVELVQSGVVRIAELQGQGFAYLKVE